MTTLTGLVEEVTELYRDTEFSRVTQWKDAGANRRAIGYLPVYVPRELIHAAGMLPVGVVGHGSIEIIRGDAYFQSYICHLPRSVIELGVTKRLAALDGMLFPSTCDVIRNLSGMWKILFPEKLSYYFDVPQNFDATVGGKFYRHELGTLKEMFEKVSGNEITDEALRKSIALYNENRQLINTMYDRRRSEPWLFPTSEVYLVMRAGNVMPVEEHNDLIRRYIELAPQRDAIAMDNIRVVVSGSFCEQPHIELIHTLERAGCYIVDDDYLMIYRWFTQPVDETGDPWNALVTSYIEHSTPAASVFCAAGNNGQHLVGKVRRSDADGVVFGAPSFCDPALLDQPMNANALDRDGIPYTTFLYAENTGQFQVIREQAGTFADSIRLWGEV